jgi:hypothetical protein
VCAASAVVRRLEPVLDESVSPGDIELTTDRLAHMDATDGFGKQRGDRQDGHVGQAPVARDGHCVGGDDLLDAGLGAQALDRFACEQAVRTGDDDPLHLALAKPLQHFDDRAGIRDLIIEGARPYWRAKITTLTYEFSV